MSSELDDLLSAGLEELEEVSGSKPFKIEGKPFTGTYNSFSAEREFGEDGPPVGTYPSTILAQLGQFAGKFPAPLERSLVHKRVTVLGRNLRIASAEVDSVSVRLTLENPNATK